ncbi:UDP-N-acetylmuramoyl-tripeptide--D-alanyl-D-alanine ligase [Flavobacteriaceae bacterium R38]|nr:UDP-N-acetylmuramoyl-tripeptide--D-alanyl-D-alanine ligase [Flavobacteriaceae bacterium R38]
MSINELHDLFLNCKTISTDSRKIEKDCIFFALKGENFNGNKFAEKALAEGASYAVIDEINYNTSKNMILVDDVLSSLQQLANFHRKHLNVPIISLTGSNGKTTTKELINAVLSKEFKTTATQGNLNNHIGVPLTLLTMDQHTQLGIVEMGANHLKEIDFLCSIAEPDYGLITNFGKAHLEGFGGVEGVIKGKSELYDHLKNNKKHIFYNEDDSIQKNKLNTYSHKYGFGIQSSSDVNIESVTTNPFVSLKVNGTKINSQLIGSYNANNIALAVTIGTYFKIPLDKIKDAIENYIPSNNRSQLIQKGSNKIILDAYNANPTSMMAALDNFSGLTNVKKVAFLGDMFELGATAMEEHQKIAEKAEILENTITYLIGENFFETKTQLKKFKSFEDLKLHIQNELPENATLLIKGSRGMALERILTIL